MIVARALAARLRKGNDVAASSQNMIHFGFLVTNYSIIKHRRPSQGWPQHRAVPDPAPVLHFFWQMSDVTHHQQDHSKGGDSVARTMRSPSSPAARSSRVIVSRTIFSLSRTKLACQKENKRHILERGVQGITEVDFFSHRIPDIPRFSSSYPFSISASRGRERLEFLLVFRDLGAVER